MTTQVLNHPAGVNSISAGSINKFFLALVSAVVSQLDKAEARASAKRTRKALHALPDHLLRDIGVERHNIDS